MFHIVDFDFWVAGSLVVEFPVVDSDFSVAGFLAVAIPVVEIFAAGSFVAELFFCTTVFLGPFVCCIVSALSLSPQVGNKCVIHLFLFCTIHFILFILSCCYICRDGLMLGIGICSYRQFFCLHCMD